MKIGKKFWAGVALVVFAGALVSAGLILWNSPYSPTHVIVQPYVQPGTNATLESGMDSARLVWVTQGWQGDFSVAYGTSDFSATAIPTSVELPQTHRARRYVAILPGLPLDSRIHYRVQLKKKVVAQNSFAARKSATNTIHFVAVGDTIHNKSGERRIAWQVWNRKPDFFVHLGDIVYFQGTVREYMERLWPCYNDPAHHSASQGAPLMGSIPIYPTIGNHEVQYGLNLKKKPDGLAAFYFFFAAYNGPTNLQAGIRVTGLPEQVAAFHSAAAEACPGLCFHSFDNGPAHFLYLDGNNYTDFNEPALRNWIQHDLSSSRAAWKFVVCHQPAFQTAIKEFKEQRLRLLNSIFLECGVDVIFSGHSHLYQRSFPIKFKADAANDSLHPTWVKGTFVVDKTFDGATNQVPNGIINIVSGGGGARLYDAVLNNHPVLEDFDPADWVPYTAKLISDRHSFSDVTVTPTHFTLRQIDESGKEIDRLDIDKATTNRDVRMTDLK